MKKTLLFTLMLIFITPIAGASGRTELISKHTAGMISYPATGKVKGKVIIFTDMDCSYCRKLHREVPKLNRLGIDVRYAAFPRRGVGSAGYTSLVSIWCAANPASALSQSMHGERVAPKECKNPVKEQLSLGRQLGITATPAIVFADGEVWEGYHSASEIAAEAMHRGN